MPSFKKKLLGFAITVGVILIAAILLVFVDSPFPSYSTAGLIKTESTQIALGKAVVAPNDSINKNILTKDQWFVDRYGRTMILHGINVGGSSKLPFSPLIPSHQKEAFYESVYTVSSVGRPFPLAQADEHFKRLHQWGYRFVRLVITWEAIEHAGPGKYDEDYLNYLQVIVKKAATYNINIFIDPHQDVWSRFTGGDGAPYWTLEKVGFDPLKFTETGSAFIHNIKGNPFPRMIWPTNYNKLGTATMFTLFFGGDDFAPQLKIDSLSAQDYLQTHYFNAIKQVAMKLKGLPNVIGFDTFNEPSIGYIGIRDLNAYDILKNGTMPTPFEGMILGDGNTLEVKRFEFAFTGIREKENVLVNPNKFSAWENGGHDIWKEAGAWGYDSFNQPVLLKPNHFSVVNGKPVDFSEDYFKPFVRRYKAAIHSIDSNWLIFAEAAIQHELPKFTESEASKVVNAAHWYDYAVLLTKEYTSWFGVDVVAGKAVFGKSTVRKAFHSNLARKKEETMRTLGSNPTLIGEFGIPYDLNEKSAYKKSNFSDQEACLDRSFRAMESNQLSYTLWNYTADNDNANGDQWNGEDLSIFSQSQQKNSNEINSGGRALKAAIRPYAYKVAGEPIEYFFDMNAGVFHLKFNGTKTISAPTEVFIPKYHFGKGFEVLHSPGKLEFDKENDLLLFYAEKEGKQILIVRKK